MWKCVNSVSFPYYEVSDAWLRVQPSIYDTNVPPIPISESFWARKVSIFRFSRPHVGWMRDDRPCSHSSPLLHRRYIQCRRTRGHRGTLNTSHELGPQHWVGSVKLSFHQRRITLGEAFFVSRLFGGRVCGRQQKKQQNTLNTRGSCKAKLSSTQDYLALHGKK